MSEPAPVVTAHTGIFRDVFENRCQLRHVPHELTGRIVLPHKRLAHRARGILDSAAHPNRARWLWEAPWREDALNHRWLRCLRHQTTPHRRRRRESVVVLDETRGEPGGCLFDDVDRHDHPRDRPSPRVPQPVTSGYVGGPGRVPLDRRLDRRDEALTPWEAAVTQHVIPRGGQVRLGVSVAQASVTSQEVVLVANRRDWRAAKISSLSAHRWPTDPCDRDRTGPRSGHASRRRSAEATGQHGCLGCIA